MSKKVKYVCVGGLLAALLLVAAIPFYYRWRAFELRKNFRNLPAAISASEVQAQLGRPDEVNRPPHLMLDFIFWDGKPPEPAGGKVSVEYVYVLSRSYVGSRLVLGFDSDGKLVSKHEVG